MKAVSKMLFIMIIPLIIFLLAICLGRYPLSFGEIVQLLTEPVLKTSGYENSSYLVFWFIRFPRAILVFISGAALAASGTVLQGIFKNPLVSSDILGVSSGASLGAAIAIVLWNASPGVIQLCAFCGGIIAVTLAYNLARVAMANALVSLVLAGIIINALSSAGISLLKYLADPYQQLPALEFWLMGGFHNADWKKIKFIIPVLILGMLLVILLRWHVNILSLGDDEAKSLGLPAALYRAVLIAASTFLVVSVVSVAGNVGWIGLVAPHITRFLVGNNHLKSIPASIFIGSSILLLADTLARTLTSSEIPISIITSLVGAPFLGYLLWKVGRQTRWG
jgi:iron complex transport system permease protein